MRDESGRALSNAASFPLDVATGGMPPLAKFAGAPFGIVEAGVSPAEPAMLPITLRQVQADLQGASTGGKVAIKRLDASTTDAALLRWFVRLKRDHDNQFITREQPLTNLGVHFKHGRSSSLVWVTTLDRGRPVAGARVAVNSCNGKPLWTGTTDASGLARIERGFDDGGEQKCVSSDGLFITARSQDAQGDDLSFVFSRWNRGIEPWRFNIATARGPANDHRAHTVFDRTLLRVGETVSMKHFLRVATAAGLALPANDTLPTEVVLTHVGSDAVVRLPLLDARLSGPGGVLVAPQELAFAAQITPWPVGRWRQRRSSCRRCCGRQPCTLRTKKASASKPLVQRCRGVKKAAAC